MSGLIRRLESASIRLEWDGTREHADAVDEAVALLKEIRDILLSQGGSSSSDLVNWIDERLNTEEP